MTQSNKRRRFGESFGEEPLCKVCNTYFQCLGELNVHLEWHLNRTNQAAIEQKEEEEKKKKRRNDATTHQAVSNRKRKTPNDTVCESIEIVASTTSTTAIVGNEMENPLPKFDEKKNEGFVNEFIKTYCVHCYIKFQSDVDDIRYVM